MENASFGRAWNASTDPRGERAGDVVDDDQLAGDAPRPGDQRLPSRAELGGLGLRATRAARRRTSRTTPRPRPRAVGDVVEVDADRGQVVEHLAGAVEVGVDGAGQRAVVLERVERGLGHRVDRVRADEGVDVERVGVVGVLGRRRRPQRPLHPGAPGGQRLPAVAREALEEQLVGELGVGHRRLAPQGERLVGADRVEPRSTSVSTRLTKNDATLDDRRQVALAGLEARRGRPRSPRRSARRLNSSVTLMLLALGDHLLDRRAGPRRCRGSSRTGWARRCARAAGGRRRWCRRCRGRGWVRPRPTRSRRRRRSRRRPAAGWRARRGCRW